MATYSNLHTPSPPLSVGSPSPRCGTPVSTSNGGDDSLYPKITHVTSVSVKLEPPDENNDEDQLEVLTYDQLLYSHYQTIYFVWIMLGELTH